MTPEQAEKITNWLADRSAPKPSHGQKLALQKDLLPYNYEKSVTNAKEHAKVSHWFPVIAQIAPTPEIKTFKNTFKPGIKGKAGVQIIKRVFEKTKGE